MGLRSRRSLLSSLRPSRHSCRKATSASRYCVRLCRSPNVLSFKAGLIEQAKFGQDIGTHRDHFDIAGRFGHAIKLCPNLVELTITAPSGGRS